MDLSVIIPLYNLENYIEKCLNSVMKCPKTATEGNVSDSNDGIEMECIVVNDGSKDDSEKIVRKCMKADSRIRLINKENGGVSETRNEGLKAATGNYIMFLDGDDMLVEDAWKHIIDVIKTEQSDYIAFSYITLFEDGKKIVQALDIDKNISTNVEKARQFMYADSVFNVCWGKLFKRKIISNNNIEFCVDLPVGEDFLFVAEYFRHCSTVYMSRTPVIYYLQRQGSAMRSHTMYERLEFTKILYDFSLNEVEALSDKELTSRMSVYYLKVITNLFYEYAKLYKGSELSDVYTNALRHEIVEKILNNVVSGYIYSSIKKMEYKLLCSGNVKMIRLYFSLKAML